MISISTVRPHQLAAKTGSYLEAEGGSTNLRWSGYLAEKLRLDAQPVSPRDVVLLANGFSTQGEALCQTAGRQQQLVVKRRRDGRARLSAQEELMVVRTGGHLAGLDMTICAPMSVSIMFAGGSEETKKRVLIAHRSAVSSAMWFLEHMVATLRNEDHWISAEGMLVLQADHLHGRDQACRIHTHSLVLSVCQGVDGKWGTLGRLELYKHRLEADEIYREELGRLIRAIEQGEPV